MSTSIAELAVNISTNIASLETGMAKAVDVVGRAAGDMSKKFDGLNGRIDSVTGAFKTLAAVATLGLGAKAFSDLITGSIEAQAHLVELGEKVGATASQISSLIPAAKLSGASLDEVASLTAKFSKNLLAVQDGTGKAATAFKTLGFNAQDAARFLANPTQGLFELSKRLNEFATDGNKTAIAMELIGKNAQNLLPFLTRLGEQTEIQARVSDEQAAAARRLQDEYRNMQLRGEELRNAMTAGLIPAFSAILKVFTDTTGGADSLGAKFKELAADGSMGIWAANTATAIAVVGESLAFMGKALYAFAGSVSVVVDDAAKMGRLTSGMALPFEEAQALFKQRNDDLAEANKRWASLWNDNATAVSDSLKKQLANLEATRIAYQKTLAAQAKAVKDFASNADALDLGKGQTKPTLDTGGVTAIAKVNEFAKALQDFRKAAAEADAQLGDLFSGENTTKAEKALAALKASDVWATFTAGQKAAIDGMAELAVSVEKNVTTITAYNALLATLTGTLDNFAPDFASKFKTLTDAFNLGITDLELYRDQVQKLLNQQPFAKREADALKELIKQEEEAIKDLQKMQDVANQTLSAYADQTTRIEQEVGLIGLSNNEREKAVILLDAQADRQKLINAGDVEGLAILDDQIKKRQDLVDTRTQRDDFVSGWTDVFKTVSDKAGEFVSNFVKTGKLDFKGLWQDFEAWALAALAKIAAQKIIVQIAGSFGLGGAASNAFAGGSGGAGNILSLLGGSGGLAGGIAGLLPAGEFAAGLAGDAFMPALAGVGAEAAAASAGFGAAAAAMVPVVGWIAAAGIAIYSLIQASKTPAQVKGQLQIGTGTTGFEDNAFSTTKSGLNVGFNDAATQQFSGQVGLALDQLVSGAIDSFQTRFSKQQSDAFANVLKTMTFAAFEGTFTTEDFLQKYGGQVLQQVVSAAFNILDPALGAVEAGFTGTADAVGTFTNTLLSIYDASKGFSDTFKANIVAALSDSTQATADKVAAFVSIFNLFGDTITGLGPKLEALDPASIVAFIDALGGAAASLTAMTYLFTNFTTAAQKMTLATATLNADFASLGIANIPQTHQAFLDLLNSFDLTTDAGRQLYNSVLQLAPLFVTVHGTADAAAGAINGVSDALSSAAQSAQTFFETNFYSAAEQQTKQYAADLQQITDAQKALGVTIPTTVSGFRSLIEGIDQTTPAGKALYAALIVLAPAIFDLSGAATTAATNIAAAANTINNIPYPDTASAAQKFVSNFLKKIQSLASGSTGDFGDKAAIEIPLVKQQIDAIQAAIAAEYQRTGGMFDTTIETLQQEAGGLSDFNNTLTSQLADFTILKAQYGSSIAQQLIDLESWYADQQKALRGNIDALTALKSIFDQKWASIIAGVSTGVDGTISQLDKLRQAILDYANGLSLGNLSVLSPQQKLAEAQSQFQAELAKAQGGDQGALGDITKFADTYLNLARSNFASSSQYTDVFVQVQNALKALGTPPPLTGPGSVPIPTQVVTTSGAAVATSADVQQANKTLQELLASLREMSRADRQAYLAANTDAAAEIAAAVTASGKKIGDLLGGVVRK